MVNDWSFLQHAGMNQGNFPFTIVYLICSLLMLNGVYQVSSFTAGIAENLFVFFFSKQQSDRLMAPWLILQAVGTIEGVAVSITKLNQVLIVSALIEIYCWICVLSLYKKVRQNVVVTKRN